ncbi:tudor domain-containing 6 [Thunnus albacares]|uniref:tudor domain-containing 6 n=1 Tax=Thunnus albacares TaxID=8236 RepID=UPI001CF70E53|nr:tudor domain-containing 6 [Thunnus albacares]XP_044232203.1 tudor domain-containing 6 [Thunnus albacares]
MSSILGLPTRGSDVTILITRVHLHPFCVLVEFWGKFSQERTADYQSLAKDIQSPGNTFQEFEGNPGDQCLVQIDGTWYRSRIVSRNGSKYSVFLIDKGMTNNTITSMLAWGKKEHFHLPPEVEFCLLANVLPLSPENRWSPVALEFLKSLSGKSVKAHVQDVLVSHRTFVLHIPCISKQMYEMGFAKKLAPDMFQDFVLMSLQAHSGAEVSPETQQSSMGAGERLHKQELYMYPELPSGTVETVIVTEVTNPQRIFCQLKVFSREMKKLSEQITQCFEGRTTNCIVGPEMIGFPCAARGSDGRWYRSVLQQVLPSKKVVEVLNVDYGTKQFVQVKNVRPLATEFFRMPVVTYICSLHGILDKGVGWTTTQIDYLRTLLLHKTVIAKFEYQSISEGVHYVTLYGDENTNINNLFGSKESCFLECEKTLGDYAIRSTAYSRQHPAQQEKNQKKMLPSGQVVEDKGKEIAEKLPVEDLSLNSSHVAFVQHASNPSEFWIQTQNYANELDELMDNIYHLYKDSVNKDVVRNPTVGLCCAAKAEDGDFYRATVSEVGEKQIKVFFVDYGNTEVVDRSNIRILPEEFRKLPWLALKCTLAGVRPKDGRWSQGASEFFIKAVTDKVLNVHVTAKYDDAYVVELTDPEGHGERDLTKLMCSSGLAERDETQKQPKARMAMLPAIIPATPHSDVRLSGVYKNSGMSFQTQNTVGPASNERRIATFKENMFPIGSVLDVSVSYIDRPNDFWCQLVQNAGHLKLLMHDIQAHYAGSEFQPLVETACIARHPDNGMWYRALVINKHETPHVDVLFVDYGQTETVSLYDLRRICPEFLTLHGQAFRCSLLNPVDPTSAINDWNEEAIARFHDFVATAASNFVILKCTIYAVMYSEQKIVFNIVDLETPFESVCTSMVNLVKSAPPKKVSGPSFRLDTYYYSTHNIKTGTEEQVTVTFVNNVNQFYCQLERNTNVIKDLKMKVNNLCHQLENVKLPTVFGTLCFAKFTDGQWYRGQIKATKPSILVHFVDYGDTIEVDKSDLLPVPREANDIMSVPVQAVVCSLSDVPTVVPSEVNSWFETSATECKFRALVVAREPDGKLLVELYHGNTQLNSKIKKMFRIEMQKEEQIVCQGQKASKVSPNNAQKTPKAVPKQATEMDNNMQSIKKNNISAPKRDETKSAGINLPFATKPLRHGKWETCENGQKFRPAPLELYRPPHQRQPCGSTQSNMGNGSEPADAHIKLREENLPTVNKRLMKSKSLGAESQKEGDVAPEAKIEKLLKLTDLPAKSITSGMEAEVYVSHCNSPLSFYVQLVREEDEIFSLVEKLNDLQSTPETNSIKDMHPGDLVQAEFADDSSWYRAVVREIHGNTTALVEFVDFGNTAMMPISKMARLHKSFLQLPMYSTHCMLSDAAALGKEEMLDPEVVAAFKRDIGGNGDKELKCRFIRQSGSVWEVSLENNGVKVMCKAPTRCPTDDSEITPEKYEQVMEKSVQNSELPAENSGKSQLNICSLRYHQQAFQEGQQLAVYVTTINDAQTFWCQSADSEKLDKITLSVSEVGDAADHRQFDTDCLSPGSPCIALFSEDRLWYRGEVIAKDGDELSILFVDYGNKSKVKATDLREMPPDLFETPPQAFLCELEGFDTSHGSWDVGAVDELSVLTTDKLLQLTVIRVIREERKSRCIVLLECEGKVINEALKTWWRSSMPVNKPDAVGLSTSCETPLTCDSTEKETVLPEDQTPEETEYSKIQEVDSDKLVDLHTTDETYKLESSQKNSECSEDSHHPESPLEERDQILSECDMTTEPQIFRMMESLRETVSNEGVKIFPTIVISHTESDDVLPSDSGIEDSMLPPPDNKEDHDILTLSCVKNVVETDSEEESASAMGTIEPDESNSPSDENLQKAVDESEVAKTGLKPPHEEEKTYNMEGSADVIYSDSNEERDDGKVATARESSVTSVTAVKMVPRKAVHRQNIDLHEIIAVTSEDSKQIESDSVLPSCVLPAQQFDAPTEQEIEAGDGFQQEEVPRVTANVKNDLMTEEENSAHHEDTYSALLADTGTAASETHTYTSPSADQGDVVEEAACSVEEACLICTDINEGNDDREVVARDDCLSGVTAEEMVSQEDGSPEVKVNLHKTIAEESNQVQNESLFLCGELLHEQLIEHQRESGDISLQEEAPCTSAHNKDNMINEEDTSILHEALPSDTQPKTHTVPYPDMSHLVEEVTCLVGEICLMDVCRDEQQLDQQLNAPAVLDQIREGETEDDEQLVHTPLKQNKDFNDGVLAEETSSSADSFEAQLSKITHLSLIINDGSADTLGVEQQPEE